jgi:hypothetical protein
VYLQVLKLGPCKNRISTLNVLGDEIVTSARGWVGCNRLLFPITLPGLSLNKCYKPGQTGNKISDMDHNNVKRSWLQQQRRKDPVQLGLRGSMHVEFWVSNGSCADGQRSGRNEPKTDGERPATEVDRVRSGVRSGLSSVVLRSEIRNSDLHAANISARPSPSARNPPGAGIRGPAHTGGAQVLQKLEIDGFVGDYRSGGVGTIVT